MGRPQTVRNETVACFIFLLLILATRAPADPMIINLWPGTPPGDTKEWPPEADQTKPDDKLIACRRIIKLAKRTKVRADQILRC